MADGIGRIIGGSSYGVGGYIPHRKQEESVDVQAQDNAQAQQQNESQQQIDPNKIMEFLAQNNYFMPPVTEVSSTGLNDVNVEQENRIAGYMEMFELIYSIIETEFGSELAPNVMNVVMDNLMGLAA